MMETKLWIGLCALLLISWSSADHGADHVTAAPAPVSEAAPEAAGSVPALNPVPIDHAATAPPPDAANTSPVSKVNSSLSNNASAEGGIPEATKENDTSVASASEAVVPETTTTEQPPVPPSGSHAPTSSTSTTSTTASPTHTVQAAATEQATAAQHTTTSSEAAVSVPDATMPSNESSHPKTHSSTSVPTPEPPKPETTTANAATATAQPSLTSSTSSSQEPPKSPTLTSAQKPSQPDGQPETTTEAHLKYTISSPSAQANARANTPSQLTVGGDTKMVHESPTLDPLLAGLVSAFIITAVIITLLLFLKLRRRDNRPEFRRLQDLPMDDMMEDTPLSMYSY